MSVLSRKKTLPSAPSSIGRLIFDFLNFIGQFSLLMKTTFLQMFSKPFYGKLVIEQIYHTGLRSAPLVIVTSLSVGMVMALQFGIGLEKFGGKLYVPRLVSVSFLRELGPALTSVMIAARVSAGIASEVGSMVVTQQIDAILALGTSPIKRIVIPRVIGVTIALPLLVVFANMIGIGGALFVASIELGLDPLFFYKKLANTLELYDYMAGFCKTPFFAIFIAIAGCHYGLTTSKGTRGVGIATTRAVVVSCILIFISDYILTKFFWIIEQWMRYG